VHFYSPGETDLVEHAGEIPRATVPSGGLAPEYGALLVETYLAALGGTEGIPCLAIDPAAVPSLPLAPEGAFVLSRIDGGSSVEDVVDMSGLARVEALRILCELLQRGIIRVD
jgi:hypothetical protein